MRLEGRRPLLWEMVNTCGLRRTTVLPRHCLWSHISPGRAGEARTNEVKVSPDEPCSALGVDRECQFSASGTLYVLRDGERTIVLRGKMGHRKHTAPESTPMR